MTAVIQVENLSKKYIISHQQEPYRALRDVITHGVQNVGRKLLRHFSSAPIESFAWHEEFWALRELSLTINEGERVGIIGRNGAGKSTLLKILSRITEPTTGRICLKGRVASLLEVGTGFHPELTGRENIFLNGAILGMSRAEIKQKFDAIVSFSEIEKFLDTPVKRYSSGMYVRLAFAVAAHLEPEILLVDEVLAVGDAQFQTKCLGKMESVAREGRTILFVSHNMGAIRQLCSRCFLLTQGRIEKTGSPDETVGHYLLGFQENLQQAIANLSQIPRAKGCQTAILEAWIENENGTPVSAIPMGSSVKICYRFKATRLLKHPAFGLNLYNMYGYPVTSFASYLVSNEHFSERREGVVVFDFPEFPLLPGNYSVSFGLGEEPYQVVDSVAMALHFTVAPYDVFGTGKLLESGHGVVYLKGKIFFRE